jgi:hypothetical protein
LPPTVGALVDLIEHGRKTLHVLGGMDCDSNARGDCAPRPPVDVIRSCKLHRRWRLWPGTAAGKLAGMTQDHTFEDGPGGPLWSRPCLAQRHVECGHYASFGYGLWDGGRLSLAVCRCDCHSTCLLTGRGPFVSRAIWDGLCTCPGAELAADALDQAQRDAPDFGDFARRSRERWEKSASARDPMQRREAKREAFEATRAASPGRSRAQIREIYVAELHARGLTEPSGLVLDATADAIARNRDKFTVLYSARVLAELGRELRKLFSDPSRGPDS